MTGRYVLGLEGMAACRRGEGQLGRMFVVETGQLAQPALIINFLTKSHWRARSRLSDIEAGLADLRQVIQDRHITSIAVPPLGCGNGGLDWHDVRPLIAGVLGEARHWLEAYPDHTADQIGAVLRLVTGFASAYGLKLLATVHWVLTREGAEPGTSPEDLVQQVGAWSNRKGRLFAEVHVRRAADRLAEQGWVPANG